MKHLLLFLAAASLATRGFAESAFEREMKQLKSQRDAAVAASTKAQDERYRVALEQVYRRAVQAKDAAAIETIKTELLTLGPLRELPPLGAATASQPALPSNIFGAWTVTDASGWKAVYNFKADGTCERIPGSATTPDKVANWSKSGSKIEVTWPDGKAQAFDLPVKAGKLEGYNPDGSKLWASKNR